MLTIRDIIREIEQVAPLALQEDFDNSGIQVGDVSQQATGALISLDVTEEVIDEAIGLGYNLIISHHPLAFRPFKSLTGANYVQRCMMKACKHDLVIYAAHTNLDNAYEGVNAHLSSMLELQNTCILSPMKNKLMKLVTFVPQSHSTSVRQALFDAGAGHIGNYDYTSYSLEGKGTFRANNQASPYCGKVGELHQEDEVRIETIMPVFLKHKVVSELLKMHPYEEPVYDLYPIANTWGRAGSGFLGELPRAYSQSEFIEHIKKVFGATSVSHSAFTNKEIKKVAICGGSGAFLMNEAIRAEADVFITGEAKYNDYYDVEGKILLAVIGHYESEVHTKQLIHNIISKKNPTFAAQLSNVNSNPVKYS